MTMREPKHENRNCAAHIRLCAIAFASLWLFSALAAAQEPIKTTAGPRLIEVIADHKSHFTVPGQSEAEISVRAGEKIRLRITAIKAVNRNRDGSVHGFTLLRAKDHQPVDGWDFLLQPGTQEFIATAPTEPGNYEVVCTVICSENHEHMSMKFTVLPSDK
jgi:heme/copper-type cytochrome/quinol oxidase subunit 2